MNPLQLYRSLLLERLRWRLLIILLALLASTVGIAAPLFQKHFTEAFQGGNDGRPWLLLAFLCILLYQALWQLNNWIATREGLITQKALGERCVSRLLEGPGGLIGKAPAGVAVSLFAVDVPGAAALIDQALLMGASLVFPLLLAPLVLHFSFGIPWSAIIAALTALLLINLLLARRQSRFFLAFKALAAERTGLVSEWVQNIRTLRILGWVRSAESKIFALRRKETVNRKKMVTNGQVMNAIASSATFWLNLLAVALLLHLRKGDPPAPGELLSLLWVLGIFLARPLRQLPWTLVMSFDALSSLRRLSAAYAIPLDRPQLLAAGAARCDAGSLHRGEGADRIQLEVRGLYLEFGGQTVLKDLAFRFRRGSFVAIVGDVGSGKTQLLLSLIGGNSARFESYRFGGAPCTGPLDPAVRGKIAYVPQEGFTISATLRENVRFQFLDAIPAADDPELLRALEAARFSPGRERLPQGLASEIGEKGVNLSGGQRQRIGLARAAYAGRELMLLDDCLSAVDVDTEKQLLSSLFFGAWKDRTRVLATHRLSVLPHCDEVIFLRDGRIEDQGSFHELMIRCPSFRSFLQREERPPPTATPDEIPAPSTAGEGEE